jgi:hypothetical protein
MYPFPIVVMAFVALVGATIATPKANGPSVIGPDTVRLIENKVVMPRGADPLAEYDRFYMLITVPDKGRPSRDVVQGRFMLRTQGTHFRKGAVAVPGIPNTFTIERGGRLPNIADGGCYVVTVYFDLTSGELMELVQYEGAKPELAICNGYA